MFTEKTSFHILLGQFICARLYAEYFMSKVLQVLSLGTPGSSKPFPGTGKIKTIFMTTLRHYLPFSLSFSHECIAEFSIGYMGDNPTD